MKSKIAIFVTHIFDMSKVSEVVTPGKPVMVVLTYSERRGTNFLEKLFPERSHDPKQLLANEVVRQVNSIMRTLVSLRKHKNYTQSDVAKQMGVGREAVTQLEKHDGNPTLSSIKRYALAVDALIEVRVSDGGAWAQKKAVEMAMQRYMDEAQWPMTSKDVIDLNVYRSLRNLESEADKSEVS